MFHRAAADKSSAAGPSLLFTHKLIGEGATHVPIFLQFVQKKRKKNQKRN